MFFFEQLLRTAMDNIDSSGITRGVLGVAGAILLFFFIYSFFEGFAAGGDVRIPAVSGIKFLIVGLIFASYGTAFRDVNAMFSSVGQFIYHANNVGDVFGTWMDQMRAYWAAQGYQSVWKLIAGGYAGLLSAELVLFSFLIYALAYVLFTVFYAFYGAVLYVSGPFVLAFLPSRGLGQLARAYLVNLMTFQAWGLIYGLLQVLMTAINLGSMNAVLNANGVLNVAQGATQMVLLALTSSLFALSIAFIPFIASRIVRGDVGSTMMTMLYMIRSVGASVAGAVATGGTGAAAGGAAAAGGGSAPGLLAANAAPPPPPPTGPSFTNWSASTSPPSPATTPTPATSSTSWSSSAPATPDRGNYKF